MPHMANLPWMFTFVIMFFILLNLFQKMTWLLNIPLKHKSLNTSQSVKKWSW